MCVLWVLCQHQMLFKNPTFVFQIFFISLVIFGLIFQKLENYPPHLLLLKERDREGGTLRMNESV